MEDIQILNSKYQRFVLKSEFANSIEMEYLPIGWDDDALELVRNDDYDGVMTQFTNNLEFIDDEKEYIERAFKIGGINTNLYLTKYSLVTVNGDTFWDVDYIGLADFNTRDIKNGRLTINFNSNRLEELIKSHENDIFELERLTSIDDEEITQLQLNKTEIKGRTLIAEGLSEANIDYNPTQIFGIDVLQMGFNDQFPTTCPTTLITRGVSRHSSVDTIGNSDFASQMFFPDLTIENNEINVVRVAWDLKFWCGGFNQETLKAFFRIYEYDDITDEYNLVEEQELLSVISPSVTQGTGFENDLSYFEFNGVNTMTVAWNQGIMLCFEAVDTGGGIQSGEVFVKQQTMKVGTTSTYNRSEDLSCIPVHQAVDRLLEIITGKKGLLKSKIFGSTELGYLQDGEFGLIHLISGYWVRAFDPETEKYKSMQLSLKKILEDLKIVFGVGIGIQDINFVQKLRIEDKRYFYQNKFVVDLGEIYDENLKADKKAFYSGIELGYNKGGDYENEIGLDEPNTITRWVTPLRKTKNKYRFLSDTRSDEYGLEITRRKPQFLFPEEDTGQDDHNWFLDLKRTEIVGQYTQKDWEDSLQSEPVGVLSPETYRSWLFTPLRILLRHSRTVRVGMNEALNLIKKIKYVSSKANTNLETRFIGESETRKENDDLIVGSLDRPYLTYDTLTFKANISEEVHRQIFDYTQILVNGQSEYVRNYLFKFKFTREDGTQSFGFLKSYKPQSKQFEMYLSNEIIN